MGQLCQFIINLLKTSKWRVVDFQHRRLLTLGNLLEYMASAGQMVVVICLRNIRVAASANSSQINSGSSSNKLLSKPR